MVTAANSVLFEEPRHVRALASVTSSLNIGNTEVKSYADGGKTSRKKIDNFMSVCHYDNSGDVLYFRNLHELILEA